MTYDVQTVMPAKPRRPWVRPVTYAVGVVLVAGTAVGAYALTTRTARAATPAPVATVPDTIAATGRLTVEHSYNPNYVVGEPCLVLTAGYGDIVNGAQVTITDRTGTVLVLASLNDGRVVEDPILSSVGGGGDCAFSFAVRVPGGAGIYGVEVAHRGVVRFNEADLRTTTLELTL